MHKIEKEELTNSAGKLLFSLISYVGSVLNEVMYDYRGRVKQERINNFIILLSEYFGNNPEADEAILKSEDFGDLFESVLKRVALTKSQEKHIRFRDILTNYINDPYPNVDDTETYLELVNYLNETAIIILKHHKILDVEFDKKQTEFNQLNEEIIGLQSVFSKKSKDSAADAKDLSDKMEKLSLIDKEFTAMKEAKMAKFYGLTESSYLYYKQILFARGLLSDKGIGAISSPPFFNMGITEFGRKFIAFIIMDKNSEDK